MDTQIYDELKTKLSDSKTKVKIGDEEKSVLDYILWIEEGVEKTKSANRDLTSQRESWEAKEKEYKKNLTDLNTLKADLEKKAEEATKVGGKKSQESEELQRQINAALEKITSLEKAREDAEKRQKDAEEKAKQANAKASEESLRKDLITELAEYKIVGTQADYACQIILSKGYARLIADPDTGLYKRSICTNKDGKELAADMKTMCKWFAEISPFLVSASGKTGTGMNHEGTRSDRGHSNNGNYLSMISNPKK